MIDNPQESNKGFYKTLFVDQGLNFHLSPRSKKSTCKLKSLRDWKRKSLANLHFWSCAITFSGARLKLKFDKKMIWKWNFVANGGSSTKWLKSWLTILIFWHFFFEFFFPESVRSPNRYGFEISTDSGSVRIGKHLLA